MTHDECMARLMACPALPRGERLAQFCESEAKWSRERYPLFLTLMCNEYGHMPHGPSGAEFRRVAAPLRRARMDVIPPRVTKEDVASLVAASEKAQELAVWVRDKRIARMTGGITAEALFAILEVDQERAYGVVRVSVESLRAALSALQGGSLVCAECEKRDVGESLLRFFEQLAILVRRTPAPCPWCGGDARLWGAHMDYPRIDCGNPEHSIQMSACCNDDDAVALWNRVAIPAAFARLKDGE